MHIVILAPVHPYSDIRVFRKEARALAAAGHKVDLLARADHDLEEDGVNVIAQPAYKHRAQRFIGLLPLMWRALQMKADAYHLHNPDTIPVGLFLKLCGKKVVYDTHENFRDLILYRTWIPNALRNVMAVSVYMIEKLAAKVFNKTIVTQKRQVEIYGSKTELIENAPITDAPIIEQAKELAKSIEKDDDTFYLVYPGLISAERGVFQLVSILKALNEKVKARLWLMGMEGDEHIIDQLKALDGWEYVDYFGQQSQLQAFSYMAAADVGMIAFLPHADNPYINPNKIFEYQVFATPYVASNFPTWRSYMDGEESGLWVNPESADEIIEALVKLADNPELREQLGNTGQAFTEQRYNWNLESQKLIALYKQL